VPSRKVFIFGDSHTVAIADAVARRTAAGRGKLEFVVGRFAREKPNGTKIRGVTLDEAVATLKTAGPKDILVAVVGGNQYNSLGLLEHPEPYDFMVTPADAKTLTPQARIIPVRQVEAAFETFLSGWVATTVATLRGAFKGKAYYLETPPPKADADYIRANAEAYFRTDGVVALNVSPAPFRRRLWQVQSRMTERLCESLDLGFVRAPRGGFDAEGYMARECYGGDATHASAAYGELVLRDLEALLSAKSKSEVAQ
jgi:hypothetical protein